MHADRRRATVAALRERLGDGVGIEIVERTGSTNADLVERLAGDATRAAARPTLRVAELQTAGRGRLGRRWHGAPGASLACSLAIGIARADLSGLSLAVGVAVADALDAVRPMPLGAPPIGLKWPNDLVLVDAAGWRKLGGILIETVPRAAGRVVVIGVGVNVGAQALEAAGPGVGWLADGGATPTVEAALLAVAPALLACAAGFERDGFAAAARAAWAKRDVLAGRRVRAAVPSAADADAVEGIADGIADDGSLRVRLDDGRRIRVASGEVSVRALAMPVAGVERSPC